MKGLGALGLILGCGGLVLGPLGPFATPEAAGVAGGAGWLAGPVSPAWGAVAPTDATFGRRLDVVRVVRFVEADGVRGVETTLESDVPSVVARLHELAERLRADGSGAAEPDASLLALTDVAADAHVERDITALPTGVRVRETSRQPGIGQRLWWHALRANAAVRAGAVAGAEAGAVAGAGDGEKGGRWGEVLTRLETTRPVDEAAVAGLPHRFLLAQPDAGQVAVLHALGAGRFVNFRPKSEHPDYDQSAAAESVGASYCNLPYRVGDELTDELLDAVRAEYRAAAAGDLVLALNCRTGGRVGPGLAAYLALDEGVPLRRALYVGRAVGLVDPLYESRTRDYIRRTLAEREGRAVLWQVVSADVLTPEQQQQKALAEQARAEMFGRLFKRLGEAMAAAGPDGQAVGPSGAVAVCKDEAPKIAQQVAREKGVMIGRTSDRLRNPGNVAPPWASAVLAEKPAEPRVVLNTDGTLGLTLPVRLASNCIVCHGAPEQIDPATRAALQAAYPQDRATGYREGDIRGWFWIEVPAVQ